jgi:hypothetical protein
MYNYVVLGSCKREVYHIPSDTVFASTDCGLPVYYGDMDHYTYSDEWFAEKPSDRRLCGNCARKSFNTKAISS